ncbi:hypothetical protein DFQ27_004809 [Actinomortierella ambigua]|uniref:Uncharacterized protein n=1 Tax=Actinomortierella ambigua TaxID=1343610 RepID=A0A9P6U3J4_9FUNG|nr:hypothetical protein DFQ27_004809 [Actinomortierella ambigua]
MAPPALAILKHLNAAQLVQNILKSLPASMVISLNAWAVSAWLKATILINSQPRWLFRKKRWSEGEMRAISCYYLVVAYLMLRVVRVTSRLTKRPGRPYGDFFRHTRPLMGAVVLFSLSTMLFDELFMFYILRKFGLEKRRILITGRPLDKDAVAADDDCCICYGAMLDDEDVAETEAFMASFGLPGLMSKETDHVLENFCVVKSHVAHRGCIRKWHNYGPKGYRPMDAFRAFQWRAGGDGGAATTVGANPVLAGMTLNLTANDANLPQRLFLGPRHGLRWLLSLPLRYGGPIIDEPLRIPLMTTANTTILTGGVTGTVVAERSGEDRDDQELGGSSSNPSAGTIHLPTEEEMDDGLDMIPVLDHAAEILDTEYAAAEALAAAEAATPPSPLRTAADEAEGAEPNYRQHSEPLTHTHPQQTNLDDVHPNNAAISPPPTPRVQENEYTRGHNAGRNTCPACRQPLILQFVDLAQGRQEMTRLEKVWAFGRDLTKFSDWRGLVLRSGITAGWVAVTIIGGKLRIRALDRSLAQSQRNRGLASISASAATAAAAAAAAAVSSS